MEQQFLEKLTKTEYFSVFFIDLVVIFFVYLKVVIFSRVVTN
jgi:hypothetical protein